MTTGSRQLLACAFVALSLWCGHAHADTFVPISPAGGKVLPHPRGTNFIDNTLLAGSGDTAFYVDDEERLHEVAGDSLRADARILPLPPGVIGDARRRSSRLLLAASPHVVWFLDGDAGFAFAWRRTGQGWGKKILIGQRVGAAAVLEDGTLFATLPLDASSSFALISEDGLARRTFGSRLSPPIQSLNAEWNSWKVAALGSMLLAVHTYQPLARLFSRDGTLIWEKSLASATLAGLPPLAQAIETIKSDPRGCCHSAKLTNYATWLGSEPDGRSFLVRWGLSAALERFSAAGAYQDAERFQPTTQKAAWQLGGLAISGPRAWALETLGVVRYFRGKTAKVLRGKVMTATGAPIEGAEIALNENEGAFAGSFRSAPDGSFDVAAPTPEMAVTLSVRAPGMIVLTRVGMLRELLAAPITLRSAARICVRAVDGRTGAAPAAFDLALQRSTRLSQSTSAEAGPAIAGKNGIACTSSPWEPPFSLKVSSAGLATAWKEVDKDLDLSREIEVTLGPEAIVRLQVESDEGPVATAKVVIERPDKAGQRRTATPAEQTAVTDSDGRAVIGRLGADTWTLAVRHPGFLPATRELRLMEGENPVTIDLRKGATGRFSVSGTSGERVGDARVELDPKGHLVPRALSCDTDATGTCSVPGMPPGAYDALVSRRGYTSARQAFAVEASATGVDVAVTMREGVDISGRVLGTSDYPDLQFTLLAQAPKVGELSTAVAADGEYKLSGVPKGRVLFWIHTTGGHVYSHEWKAITSENERVDFELPRAIRLTGKVVSEGAGCGNCSASFRLQGLGPAQPVVTARVSALGTYEARLPGEGTYRIVATDSQTGAALEESIEVTGAMERDLQLDNEALSGVVKDDGGRTVAGALVQLRSGSAGPLMEKSSDAAGAFKFQGLSRREYSVSATKDGRSGNQKVNLRGGAATAEIRLSGRSLRLRLIDAESGTPIPSISTAVWGGGGVARQVDLLPEADGVFRVAAFDGPADVVLKARGYAYKTLPGMTASGDVQTVTLLRQWRTVEIRVTSGRPCVLSIRTAAGAGVGTSLVEPPGHTSFTATSGFVYELEPGAYQFTVAPCSGPVQSKAVDLSPSGVQTLTFDLR